MRTTPTRAGRLNLVCEPCGTYAERVRPQKGGPASTLAINSTGT